MSVVSKKIEPACKDCKFSKEDAPFLICTAFPTCKRVPPLKVQPNMSCELFSEKPKGNPMKLFRENPETPEGKYPIVLRRDGSLLESRNFVMVLKDPCAGAAIRAYAEKAHQLGLDEGYVESLERLADEADRLAFEDAALVKPTSDPDAPKHREDDPVILAWARSIGCPAT